MFVVFVRHSPHQLWTPSAAAARQKIADMVCRRPITSHTATHSLNRDRLRPPPKKEGRQKRWVCVSVAFAMGWPPKKRSLLSRMRRVTPCCQGADSETEMHVVVCVGSLCRRARLRRARPSREAKKLVCRWAVLAARAQSIVNQSRSSISTRFILAPSKPCVGVTSSAHGPTRH